jgi:hypothetical protein
MLFRPAVVTAVNLMPVRSIERLLQFDPYYELLGPAGELVAKIKPTFLVRQCADLLQGDRLYINPGSSAVLLCS